MKRLSFLTLLILLGVSLLWAAQLWFADFEEGDLTDFSHADLADQGSNTASTAQAAEGTWSYLSDCTGCTGGNDAAYQMHFADSDDLHTTDTTFYSGFCIYPTSTATGIKFAGFGKWDATSPSYVSLRWVGTRAIVVRNEISAADVGTSTATVPLNTWTSIELAYKPNDTTGTIQLWIAGGSEVSVTSQDTKDGANVDARFGVGTSWSGGDQKIYFDAIELDNAAQVSPSCGAAPARRLMVIQ
ncbi:hypothetical protein LCGC14_1827560 [marine sediment metagenome]|uniref:3-keto-disaccharide hydrolase domain-containing protein n=1 Tax=marine sediment metagenome TaxID=412755 RepID=A0A0F9GHB9_9ZZZZ